MSARDDTLALVEVAGRDPESTTRHHRSLPRTGPDVPANSASPMGLHSEVERLAAEVGIRVDRPINTMGITRLPALDDRPGKRAGWVRVLADGRVRVGNFKTDQIAEGRHREATAADHKAAQSEKERQAKRRADAAQQARQIWCYAQSWPARAPYVEAKQISPWAVRWTSWPYAKNNFRLVVPLHDIRGQIHSIQFIDAHGGKQFLAGGRVWGCFCLISASSDLLSVSRFSPRQIVVCEGWATGCTLFDKFDRAPVACSMYANNMTPVARGIRRRWPRAEIIIAGDNDAVTEAKTGRNPGVEAAQRAARAVGAKAVWPKQPGDFNDQACRGTQP